MTSELCALPVLVVDAQATAARGHLLELGWARVAPGLDPPRAKSAVVRLPEGERLSRRVAAITGLTEATLAAGADPLDAYRDLDADAAAIARAGSTPTIIHYASFEAPLLADLAQRAGTSIHLDVICAHAVARRLLPDLPRCTLRALAGYFGRPVSALRRAGEHVEATAFVWRSLCALLAERAGVTRWEDLRAFVAAPRSRPAKRGYPMPREARLALPDAPGVYRLLRQDGGVLYVGKATSLRSRVNSYFRRQSGGSERSLEMLSQARDLSVTVTESALEAALSEPDEIKLHRPPYNVALREEGRALWFATADGRSVRPRADRAHRCGPFLRRDLAPALAALARTLGGDARPSPAEILAVPERWAPPRDLFDEALARFVASHGPSIRGGVRALLALGARLYPDRHADLDEEGDVEPEPAVTAADVARALDQRVIEAAHAIRRALWIRRLVDCAVAFRELGGPARVLVIERAEITVRASTEQASAPIAPGALRPAADRRRALTVASFDRLRVLTTELRRVLAEGGEVEIRFDAARAIHGDRARRALAWV